MAKTDLKQRFALASSGLLCSALLAATASAYVVDKKGDGVTLSSLADFDKCTNELGNLDMCVAGLRGYIKKHPKEAFDAGKHVRLQMTHWAALEFFVPALKGKYPERCADPDVSMAIVSGLGLPSDYPAAASAKQLSEICWEQVQPALLKALDEPGGYVNGNLCPLLTAKSVDAAKCKAPAAAAKAKPAEPSAAAQLKGIDWKALPIDPDSARAFQGHDGEQLLLARSKPNPRSFTLLKFKNVRSPWKDQVLVAIERPGGVGTDYVTAQGQDDWTALTEREGYFEAYLKGVKDSIRLFPVRAKEEAKVPTRGEIVGELSAPAKKK